jgi:hypothetical protein
MHDFEVGKERALNGGSEDEDAKLFVNAVSKLSHFLSIIEVSDPPGPTRTPARERVRRSP